VPQTEPKQKKTPEKKHFIRTSYFMKDTGEKSSCNERNNQTREESLTQQII